LDILPDVQLHDNLDDFHELMHRVHEGSEEAAWELVQRYGGYIRRAVRRVLNPKLRPNFDSLDFVQLAWHSFFRMRDQAGRFEEPRHFAKYLASIAFNKVRMEARRRLDTEKHGAGREIRLERVFGRNREKMADPEPGPVDVAIARERWNQLLKGQPPSYRQIIQLKLQGHSSAEIATMLDIDQTTVRRFLNRLLIATIP
jgi:RNA polymerase sigma factor (sigma-70 family)